MAARRCTLNESAFNEWTPEASYWAGLIFADGTIYQERTSAPKISLQMKSVDSPHLERLREFLGASHRIQVDVSRTFGGEFGFSRLSFRSRVVGDRLAGIGIVKGRGAVLEPALAASRDFWRGVVDGDGCLGFGSRRNKEWQSSPYLFAVGHRLQMEQFELFARNFIPKVRATVRPLKTIHEFRVGGVFAKDLASVLYRDAAVSLPRKQEAAKSIMEYEGRKLRLCEIEGCNRRHLAGGLCQLHYGRKWHTARRDGLRLNAG